MPGAGGSSSSHTPPGRPKSASQAALEHAFETLPDFVFAHDPGNGAVRFVSRPPEAAFGLTTQQLMRALHDSAAEALAGAAGLPAQAAQAHARTMDLYQAFAHSSADTLEFEFPLVHGDGATHWYFARLKHVPSTLDGHSGQVMGMLLDISARRRAEAARHEQQRIEHSLRRIEADLSSRLHIDEVLSVALQAALRISGASDGYIGVLEPDQETVCATLAAGAYQNGQRFSAEDGVLGRALRARRDAVVPDVRLDPDYVPHVTGTRALMVLPLAQRTQVFGVLRLETAEPQHFSENVAEHMRMLAARVSIALENARLFELTQQQLDERSALVSRLTQLEQIKTDMIRLAAHDLRNPLGTIIGFSQLLLEDRAVLSAEHVDFVESIAQSAGRIQSIITDILSLERLQEAQASAPQKVVNLAEIASGSAEECRRAAEAQAQVLRVEIGAWPLPVLGDAPQLREAMDNLISNAIKYTPPGGSITISLRQVNGYAVFEVADNGIGISPEQQSRLFTPFFRVKSEQTAGIEGTGLGLHLVRNIIERHQGRIHFHSAPGRGSMFGFELPIAEAASSALPSQVDPLAADRKKQ